MKLLFALICCCVSLAPGCATSDGVVFSPIDPPIVWPPPPQQERIRYVGQLASDTDLKPARSGWDSFRDILGGKEAVHSVVSPIATWMSPAGQLFVADSNGQMIHRFDLRKQTYDAIFQMGDRRLLMPVAVAGDTEGIIYVADAEYRAIHRFGPGGNYLSDLPSDPLGQPAGLCYDPRLDRIYVSDVSQHRVLAFTREGRFVLTFGQRGTDPGQFNYPTHLAVDRQGRVLVADSLNQRIQRFKPDGTLDLVLGQRGTAPGDFAMPKGIAVDSEGHIYVVDARFENVQVFDDQGELLIVFGEEGGGPAEFWLPAGICIDKDDRIFMADTYNRRVQVFQFLARPETPS